MAKYIRCDGCGNKIELGYEVYKFDGYAGLYCSAECFAEAYGITCELDNELAEDCYHKIYDDDITEKRAAIMLEIEKLVDKWLSYLKDCGNECAYTDSILEMIPKKIKEL